MAVCTGREIMTDILGHLGVAADASSRVLESSTCIPCMMPFITSQFRRRSRGDRPQVKPEGWPNLAFVGQFCERPDDVVFTVEYSIRAPRLPSTTCLNWIASRPRSTRESSIRAYLRRRS